MYLLAGVAGCDALCVILRSESFRGRALFAEAVKQCVEYAVGARGHAMCATLHT